MWKKTGALALAGVVLAGCGGMHYAIENYSGTEVQAYRHRTSGVWYRVFDKPAEGRMMITANLGAAAGQGFVKGLTLGLASAETPGVIYRDVALEFLAVQGRACESREVTLIVEPQYEVRYECFADRPAPPVPPPYKEPPVALGRA